MTKEQLELKVKELTAALTQFEMDQASLKSQLDKAKSDLEDINKPVISLEIRNQIRDAVSEGLSNYSFENIDNYDIDFDLNYDNRIEVSNIDFTYISDLEEVICCEIEDLFKIKEDE